MVFKFIVLIGTLIVSTFAVLFYSYTFGWVSGTEFSPQTFKRRSFSYVQFPFTKTQLSPLYRNDSTGTLEQHLNQNKLLGTRKNTEVRWDLVQDNVTDPRSEACDSAILCSYLDAGEQYGEPVWLAWSNTHPKMEKILWPKVALLARHNLYYLVPAVMNVAQAAADDIQLKKELETLLYQKFLELGDRHLASEELEEAVELYSLAVLHGEKMAQPLLSRAKAYSALGDGKKAEKDRALAKTLETTN